MNEQEKSSNYEEMRRGQALQTLLASAGGEILKELLLGQYRDSFNQLMKGFETKGPHLIRMQVIEKLMKDMNGEVDFGELAQERLAKYQNKGR